MTAHETALVDGGIEQASELVSAWSLTRGHKFEADKDLSEKLVLLSDGTLYVVRGMRYDTSVLSYVDKLERANQPHTVQEVPYEDLRLIAAGHYDESGRGEASITQAEVVKIIGKAVAARSSDIHVRNHKAMSEVLFRIDGLLERQATYPSKIGRRLCATIYNSMLDTGKEVYNERVPQDGRVRAEFTDKLGIHGARVATRPGENGNVMVLRLLSSSESGDLERLGYLPSQIALINAMTRRTSGINLFSGPTGSGKSTSMEVLLSQLVKNFDGKINLITAEDPPEKPIHGAFQTPVGADGWDGAIANMMRLDPDVIAVGEIRDLPSAIGAVRAALSGHGVWSTNHANSATQTLSRLRDLGVDITLLADASIFTGIINQSLVPLLCMACRRPYREHFAELAPDLRARIERHCDPEAVYLSGNTICAACDGKGHKGRQAVAEVLVPTQKFMNVFRHEGAAASRTYWVKQMGGITKCAHLLRLINSGKVDPVLGEMKVCTLDDDALTLDLEA